MPSTASRFALLLVLPYFVVGLVWVFTNPLGVAARIASTPSGAFHAARLVSLLIATILLFAAVWHLARSLGRWSTLGLVVALTPMAIFASASVSTSGMEIMSAVALAAVMI